MSNKTLKAHTLELVLNRPRTITYDKICADTGLKKNWLERFAQGQIPSPGVEKVEALFNYLNHCSLGHAIEMASHLPNASR